MKKTYDKAFKIEITKQIMEKKTTVSAVASEYGISRPIVSRCDSEFNRYGNHAFSDLLLLIAFYFQHYLQ